MSVMSATVPPSGAPSLKWTAGAGAGAFGLFLLGAVVVEPALHRAITPGDAPIRVHDQVQGQGQVVTGEPVVAGRYASAGSETQAPLAIHAEGGVMAVEGAGALTAAPHRLARAGDKASDARTFARVMGTPAAAQIEIRRVTDDRDSRLCGGQTVGWLALAVRRDGFVLMPVRQGPPPGALTNDERLCAARDFSR